jgi:hypothetical protein
MASGDPSPVRLDALTVCLCADDYGLTAGAGTAIRDLVARARISAVSCMSISRHWPAEAPLLRPLAAGVQVGLHFTLTDDTPLTPMPRLAPSGRLPSLGRLLGLALAGRVDRREVADELDRQIARFAEHWGRLPDFLDGHQHVHQFPVVRDAIIEIFAARLLPGGAWMRFAATACPDLLRFLGGAPRAIVINGAGLGFRRRATRAGIWGNRRFRGVRLLRPDRQLAASFTRLLDRIEPGTLAMCHPGLPDDGPEARDGTMAARAEEYAFLASDAWPAALAARGLALGPLTKLPVPDPCRPMG